MSYDLVIKEKDSEVFVPYLNKTYKLREGCKLNIFMFVKDINLMFGSVSHIDELRDIYRPILESYMDFAFFCFNNNIYVHFLDLEDKENSGMFKFRESYGVGKPNPELFSWFINIGGMYIYLYSSDRETYKYYIVKKELIAVYEKYAFGLVYDYIDDVNANSNIPASKTRYNFLGIFIFGSESSYNEDKHYKDLLERGIITEDELSTIPTPADNDNFFDDEDDDDFFKTDEELEEERDRREYEKFMRETFGFVPDENGNFIPQPEQEESNDEEHDYSEDEVDINSVDFSNYADVRIPEGEIIVKAVFALVLEGTNKPIAIRSKTNSGYYDMNIETALSFGFRIAILEKAIIVQHINGVYASATERKYNKYVDDISRNKADCKRLVDSIMRR